MPTSQVIDTSTIASDSSIYSPLTSWFASLVADALWTVFYLLLDVIYYILAQASGMVAFLFASVPVPTQVLAFKNTYTLPPDIVAILVSIHAPEVFAFILFIFALKTVRTLAIFI